MSKNHLTRRAFLEAAASAAAVTVVPRHVLGGPGRTAPSGKLNVACIGIGGRGGASVGGTSGENIIALCDVDQRRAGRTFEKHSSAKAYKDFRKMFDEMEKKIDAVTVATPDHTHAVACMAAITRGKHVFCEKPLAHSIYEIRQIMEATKKHRVITQLGNQGHSAEAIRLFCEWIWDGAIGAVHTIHAACTAVHCKIDQLPKLKEKHDVPSTLDWDLWLGPAQFRPYNPVFLPGSWRGWSPFGSGTIGDWVCHVVDPVFWALDLGSPVTIQARAQDYDPKKHAMTFPKGSIIKFEFPAKGKRGPITLYWYSGVERIPRPKGLGKDRKVPGTGAVVLGTTGGITYGSHGANGVRIFPEAKMRAYKQPDKTIPRVRGHHNDWLEAIRKARLAGSHFHYGGPLTEIARLGIIAMQLLGQKLVWDGVRMQFKNNSLANRLINPPYREGWSL